jgi:hypothetical protein
MKGNEAPQCQDYAEIGFYDPPELFDPAIYAKYKRAIFFFDCLESSQIENAGYLWQ